MNRPPYEKSPETARLFAHAKQCAAELGIVLDDVPMTGGGSDGNFTAVLGVPTLDGLGIDGDGAHTLHQYRARLIHLASRAPDAEPAADAAIGEDEEGTPDDAPSSFVVR